MTESETQESAAERFATFIDDLSAQGHNASLQQAPGATDLDDLAAKLGCDAAQLHKTVCLNYKDNQGRRHLIAVIVPATGRVDMEKVRTALQITPKVKAAQPDFITSETGFVPGGIPPLGFDAIRLVQASTLHHQAIFAGGGNNLSTYTRLDPNILSTLYPDIIVGDFLQQ